MRTATLTFPDGTTATLADQESPHRYGGLLDYVGYSLSDGYALGTKLAGCIRDYAHIDTSLGADDVALSPENQPVVDRIAALAPGEVVKVDFAGDV